MHEASVGQLVDVDVGCLSLIFNSESYPVVAGTPFHDRHCLLVDAVLEYDGRESLDSVGCFWQVDFPVLFGTLEILGRSVNDVPVEVVRVVVNEVGECHHARVERSDGHGRLTVGDVDVCTVFPDGSVWMPNPCELARLVRAYVVDDVYNVVEVAPEVAREAVGVWSCGVCHGELDVSCIEHVGDFSVEHATAVLLLSRLSLAVEEHHVVRFALEEVVSVFLF